MPRGNVHHQSGTDEDDDSGSGSGSDSGSEGSGGGSGHNSSRGSSPAAAVSPRGSRSPSGSPKSPMQVDSPKSPGSPGSPPGSPRSPIGSPAGSHTSRSRSGSPAGSAKSGSRSRSGSRSSGSRSGSGSRSRSGSKSSGRSRSASPPGSAKSGSASPPAKRARSRSASKSSTPVRSRSRSATPARSKSRSRSGSRSSRSSSAHSNASSRSGGSKKSSVVGAGGIASPKSEVSKPVVVASRTSPGSGGESPDSRSVVSAAQKSQAAASDIFGDADDISSSSSDSDDEKGKAKEDADKTSDTEREHKPAKKLVIDDDDEEEGDKQPTEDVDAEDAKSDAGSRVGPASDAEPEPEQEVEEPPPETRIDVEIPKITTDLGKAIHFVKLPNFLSVEPRPFDPNTYEDEIDDEETLDEEGRARLKLKVENTIRWRERFNDKGEFVKESNARFVRWSDGTLSLHLGGEIFNVYKQPLQGDHNHMFIRQGTGLQGQAVFRTKLTFRPHSTESFTHRKMTLSLADRSQKTQGIKVISNVGSNPEARREEMMKKEEDRLRASVRRESKQRRVRERVTGRGGGLSASYLEQDLDDDDDENVISLSAIKNRYKKGNTPGQKSRANIYSSDDEDDENEGSDIEDTMKARRLEKAKALKMSDEEDEEAGPSTRRIDDDHSDDGGRAPPAKAISGSEKDDSD